MLFTDIPEQQFCGNGQVQIGVRVGMSVWRWHCLCVGESVSVWVETPVCGGRNVSVCGKVSVCVGMSVWVRECQCG